MYTLKESTSKLFYKINLQKNEKVINFFNNFSIFHKKNFLK